MQSVGKVISLSQKEDGEAGGGWAGPEEAVRQEEDRGAGRRWGGRRMGR